MKEEQKVIFIKKNTKVMENINKDLNTKLKSTIKKTTKKSKLRIRMEKVKEIIMQRIRAIFVEKIV